MPDDEDWWRMCPPCAEVRHDECIGAHIWCECLAEVLMEAEDIPDDPS